MRWRRGCGVAARVRRRRGYGVAARVRRRGGGDAGRGVMRRGGGARRGVEESFDLMCLEGGAWVFILGRGGVYLG